MFGLGATHFGLGFLLVAYLFVSDGTLLILLTLERANDRAILFPLLVPPILAGAFLAANALA